jgi:hypothetical protein
MLRLEDVLFDLVRAGTQSLQAFRFPYFVDEISTVKQLLTYPEPDLIPC